MHLGCFMWAGWLWRDITGAALLCWGCSPCLCLLPLGFLTVDGEFHSLCSVFAVIWELVLFSADALRSWCALDPSLKLWHMEDGSLVSVSEITNAPSREMHPEAAPLIYSGNQFMDQEPGKH